MGTSSNPNLLSLDEVIALVNSGEAATSPEMVTLVIESLVGTTVRELELQVDNGEILFHVGFGHENTLQGPSITISLDKKKNFKLGFGIYRVPENKEIN